MGKIEEGKGSVTRRWEEKTLPLSEEGRRALKGEGGGGSKYRTKEKWWKVLLVAAGYLLWHTNYIIDPCQAARHATSRHAKAGFRPLLLRPRELYSRDAPYTRCEDTRP